MIGFTQSINGRFLPNHLWYLLCIAFMITSCQPEIISEKITPSPAPTITTPVCHSIPIKAQNVSQLMEYQESIFQPHTDWNWLPNSDALVVATPSGAVAYTWPSLEPTQLVSDVVPIHFAANHSSKWGIAMQTNEVAIWSLEGSFLTKSIANERQQDVLAITMMVQERLLASSSSDGSVFIWQHAPTGLRLVQEVHFEETVSQLAFHPTERLLAISQDKTVQVWDIDETETKAEVIMTHDSNVADLVFSPNGRFLVSSSSDNDLQMWNLHTEELVVFSGNRNGFAAITFNPDQTLLAASGRDGSIRLWQLPNGDEIRALRPDSLGITQLAFSPNGRWLGVTDKETYIRFWHIEDCNDK